MYKKAIALVLSGGTGSRINSAKPKQFIEILNKPIIVYTLEAFQTACEIDGIVIVSADEYIDEIKTLANKFGITKIISYAPAGSTRQESAFNGLKAIKALEIPECVVCIHDCARPLVSLETILDNIRLAQDLGACATAVPSTDTMLVSENKATVSKTLNRTGLYAVQTPQSFIFSKIYAAHEKAVLNNDLSFTDDSGLYLKYGDGSVGIAKGDKLNFKVTYDEDLYVLEAIIQKRAIH